jgi:hypothetical protein
MLKFRSELPTVPTVRLRFPTVILAAAALALTGAPAAVADSGYSSNWAGYAVHRSGVGFRQVVAAWKQPKASCVAGNQTYSATWVGLGGYSQTSNALEQIGTEVDCNASGRVESSAWYELVPAPSQPISLTVHPGDNMSASVTVVGHRVVVALYDATHRQGFTKALYASSIDVSSADWIVEAPSACISDNSCQTLPLANFGSETFLFSGAVSTGGHAGTISDKSWDSTQITLSPGGRRFVVYKGAGAATPSGLSMKGSSFKVTYNHVITQGNPFLAQRSSVSASAYMVHPGR